jgi:hypothetical protein
VQARAGYRIGLVRFCVLDALLPQQFWNPVFDMGAGRGEAGGVSLHIAKSKGIRGPVLFAWPARFAVSRRAVPR